MTMARDVIVRSRGDVYQRFETLKRNREKRHKQGVFFVESVHAVEQAVAHGWQFEAMAVSEGERLSGWAEDMIRRGRPETLYRFTSELKAELSDREETSELLALVRMRDAYDELDRMRLAPGAGRRLYVAFDRPQNPGNLGSVIRSADAMGAAGLIITGHGADLFDPLCVRASIGAIFALPVAALGGPEDVREWVNCFETPPVIVGTSAHASTRLDQVDFRRDTVLAIGNETFGLSRAWKETCDEMAVIPIDGAASSLNVACAASICLYEAQRQKYGG